MGSVKCYGSLLPLSACRHILPGSHRNHREEVATNTHELFDTITGEIYLGALVNAALVAWMFTSSQVIAPIPV
jgi:hypothetical protein